MSLFFSYRSVLYHLCPSHTPLPYILLPQPHPGVWALSAWVSDIDTASTSLLFQSFYLRLSCTVQIFLLLSDSYQSLPLLSFLPSFVPSFLVLHSFLLISTPFTPSCITSSLMPAHPLGMGLGIRTESLKEIKGSRDAAESIQPVAPINNPLFHQVNQIGTHPHLSVDSAVKIIDRCRH